MAAVATGTAPEGAPIPGAGLAHPVALLAIAVLVLNDHVGKAAFPGLITGKVSDVAGLAFFPLLLQAGVEWAQAAAGRPGARSDRVLGLAVAATAVVFALVKLDTPVTDLYRIGLGALQWPGHALVALVTGQAPPDLAPVRIATDPTDLWTLPAVLVAWAVGRVRGG
jgi:hypothetical protein